MVLRNSLLANLVYRAHFFFMLLGTIIYLGVSWFLWRSIYTNMSELNGLSFGKAFLYVGVSLSLYGLMQNWVEWQMYHQILEGDIIRFLGKPLDYQLHLFFDTLGSIAVNLVGIALPSFLLAFFLSGHSLASAGNLIFFLLAVGLGVLINFSIDFMVGLTVFLTHSIWGISTAKEVLVLFCAGAVIPLPFFPPSLRQILEWLPFQAIYATPIQILSAPPLEPNELLSFFLRQLGWLVVFILLTRFFFNLAVRRIVVNGG